MGEQEHGQERPDAGLEVGHEELRNCNGLMQSEDFFSVWAKSVPIGHRGQIAARTANEGEPKTAADC
jgi:hypothetical protein